MNQNLESVEPERLAILPVKNAVVFPGTAKPLIFSSPTSVAALRAQSNRDHRVFVVTMKSPDTKSITLSDLHEVGVVGHVSKKQQLPNGAIQVLFEAEHRATLVAGDFQGAHFEGRVKRLVSRESADRELPQLVEALKTEFFNHPDMENTPFQWNMDLNSKSIPAGRFADGVAQLLKVSLEERQKVLATLDTRERVELVYTLLLKEVKQRQFEKDLKNRIEQQMEKRQKEFFLNEQMKAIQDEMGTSESADWDDFKQRIEASEMPSTVREIAEKELKKLKLMGNNSHEATPVRNYLDWLVSVPWKATTIDNLSVNHAEEILDREHYGLNKPKQRIIEYIAVLNAVGKLKGPIICLSGPPGVGKTSLAKSIAHALNRQFARISLGGIRDEAEVRGHRRTYIGALPGKIIQTLKKAKTNNPLILLDEVDKISSYHLGGPTAALLEVLDPEQNHSFMDHYLEVEYDLSNVLFICTANNLADIPLPLRDRMEIIELSGYTELEKLEIAKRYLIPKQVRENGIEQGQFSIPEKQVLSLIRSYTREAGVRELERVLSKVCRKAVTEKLKKGVVAPSRITAKKLVQYLGHPRFQHHGLQKKNEVGMVSGLAWTSVGGETLSIEITTMKGTGKVQLTGKLGDVMKESAQAALSYVRSHANALGIHSSKFKDQDIHIHVPAGGTPKDGPSAGIAICGALVSAFTGVPIRWDVALTGEVTLRGNVLPIGGLKEKLLAARRANATKVIIPKDNETDLDDIPKEITKELKIIPVSKVSEIFPFLLEYLPLEVPSEDHLQPIESHPMKIIANPSETQKALYEQ